VGELGAQQQLHKVGILLLFTWVTNAARGSNTNPPPSRSPLLAKKSPYSACLIWSSEPAAVPGMINGTGAVRVCLGATEASLCSRTRVGCERSGWSRVKSLGMRSTEYGVHVHGMMRAAMSGITNPEKGKKKKNTTHRECAGGKWCARRGRANQVRETRHRFYLSLGSAVRKCNTEKKKVSAWSIDGSPRTRVGGAPGGARSRFFFCRCEVVRL
jgi:hypothetical protein